MQLFARYRITHLFLMQPFTSIDIVSFSSTAFLDATVCKVEVNHLFLMQLFSSLVSLSSTANTNLSKGRSLVPFYNFTKLRAGRLKLSNLGEWEGISPLLPLSYALKSTVLRGMSSILDFGFSTPFLLKIGVVEFKD